MTPNAVIVRYAEVFLKGGRRPFFVAKLKQELERQLRAAGPYRVRESYAMLTVVHESAAGTALPDLDAGPALRAAISRTFGVVNFSPCRLVGREIANIEAEVAAIADSDVKGARTFKVESSRQDKTFPLDSMELNRRLGGVVWERTGGTKVQLKDPDVTVHCMILERHAALFTEIARGPGGLPVGSAGRVMLLLSGGIDSPVAGWLAMRRGCDLDAVHFEATPYTSAAARQKVVTLARFLAGHQPSMTLHVVPFGGLQADLRDGAPGRLLVVLYRRMMLRIAERLAARTGALAIVTGENLGQVASQTLENMAAIGAATRMPILRPLVTYDKVETIAVAKRIGTYATSILPFEDCCSLFVPPHPETRADLARVEAVEARFDIEAMVSSAVAATETISIASAPAGSDVRRQTSDV